MKPHSLASHRRLDRPLTLLAVLPLALLGGCGQAPSVEVIGSFFPVWMLCLAIAIVLAFALRYILLRYKLETEVGPLALFYLSAVILFTCLLWLIFFR